MEDKDQSTQNQQISENHEPSITPALHNNLFDKFKSKWKIFVPISLLIIGLMVVGTNLFINANSQNPVSNSQPQTAPSNPVSNSQLQNAVLNLPGAIFAEYKEVKSNVKPVLQSYTLKSSELTNLTAVADDAKTQFNANQLNSLEVNGFYTQPTEPKPADPDTILNITDDRSDDMVDLYSQIGGDPKPWERKPENAVFVSTDFLIHVYHVLIDRTFQKTEEVYFQPTLKQLTDTLFKDAVVRYDQEQDPQLKASWKRLSVFYLVPLVILDASAGKPKNYFGGPKEQDKYLQDDKNLDSVENVNKLLQKYQDTTPSEIYQLAGQELDLVMKAEAFGVPSPLYNKLKPDFVEDYTQYTPRSHYARNSVLRSYFRALMWYGRHGFDIKSLDLTRDAMLMTWQLGFNKVNNKSASEVWEYIYLPTVFYVGKSDDITFYEYIELMKKIYGNSMEYNTLKDTSKLKQFQSEAQKIEGPKILSEVKTFDPDTAPTKDELLQSTKGLRFMGQRFIPDSYMFASLTQGDEKPDPETGQRLPSTPTALMIMSILGSKTADTLLNDWVTTNAPQSDKVIAKVKNQLKSEVSKYDEKTWTQNVYWAWLYNLKPLFDEHNDGYPMFMRDLSWSKKSLVTALGSWTELRHDTLLYAKQSYAELGAGGESPEPPPVPKGYVEPNLPFITRLIALTTMTRDGFNSRELLVPGQKEKFDDYLESLEFFKTIAEKELADSPISDEEYEKLRTIISINYPHIVWSPDGDQMTEQDARIGIIADVHTDAKKGQILYEATGVPSTIFVAVKDKGGARLTRGAVYSYYEFTRPVGSRLNDQDWQGIIYEDKSADSIPAQPTWMNVLVK